MRKIVFTSPGPYCNTFGAEMFEYPDDVTDTQIDQDNYDWIVQHYEMYGDPQQDDEDFEPEYDGNWQDYDPAKHDGIL